MASFWNIASRFARQTSKPTTPTSPSPVVPQSPASPAFPSTPRIPSPTTPKASQAPNFTQDSLPPSSESSTMPAAASADVYQPQSQSHLQPQPQSQRPQTQATKPLYFFREENSNLIVRGNFMTLAALPRHIDKIEWLAHQVVEQHRLLSHMITVIQEVDSKTSLPICNPQTCPTMNAAEYTYTWLDNFRNPIRIPAAQYINLVQKWIKSKIDDKRIFPNNDTDIPQSNKTGTSDSRRDWPGKNAGFPESFQHDIKGVYRQMFRCYAHLFHGHWLDPFYHLGMHAHLNTCFIHFVNVGRIFSLLDENDLKPMKPLVDLWVAKGIIGGSDQEVRQTQQTEPASAMPAAAAAVSA